MSSGRQSRGENERGPPVEPGPRGGPRRRGARVIKPPPAGSTLYLQTAEGYSPLKADLAFLPFSVGIAATSQIVAKLMRRIPPRVCVTIGPFIGSLGLF